MTDERRYKLPFIVFLVLAAGWAAWSTVVRAIDTDRVTDPGFANYSLLANVESSSELEINAAREAENINAGSFHPYVAGKSNDLDETAQEIGQEIGAKTSRR